MKKLCKKCGHEIDGKSPICMYCGATIADTDIQPEVRKKMQEKLDENSSANDGTSIKAFGAFLIIIGIVADVISMFLISSGSFEVFNAITIGGTISFLIGLALVSNS